MHRGGSRRRDPPRLDDDAPGPRLSARPAPRAGDQSRPPQLQARRGGAGAEAHAQPQGLRPAGDAQTRHDRCDARRRSRATTAIVSGGDDSLVGRLDALAASRPDATAVEDDGVALTFGRLVADAESLAARLRAAGVRPGHHVAMIGPADARRIVTALAILRAGGVYAPIDPSLPAPQIEALVAHAHCALVLRSGDGDPIIGPIRAEAARSDGAYLRFSSGSTGAPKAILHAPLTALRLGEAFAASVGVTEGDRVTLFNPFWHTLVWGTLLAGATLCLFDLRKTTPAGIARALDARRVSVYSAFPTAFRQLVSAIEPGRRLLAIRRLSLSGEALTTEDVAAARRCFAPDCVLVNSYGASELGHISSCAIGPGDTLEGTTIPAGHPVAGVALRLVDEHARRMPTGEPGEVAVRCAHLTAGYWRRADLTSLTFVDDPEHPGERLYLTGDIGRFDRGGALYIVGRKDRQVKIRGHRVLPEEIEAVLAEHPVVREAAVAPVETAGQPLLVAAVVTATADDFAPDALRAHIAARLPDYMVPTRIVRLDALPRAASGKVDWRALAEATPAPAPPSPTVPADDLEARLLQIWQSLLIARPIGLDDDFFALGGDSLAAIQVALRVETLVGRPVAPTALLEAPTIRRFVAGLRGASPPEPTVTIVNPEGMRRPLFFFLHRLCFADDRANLASLLPPDQPLVIVARHGRDASEPLPASYEAMGEERAALLRRLQPDGPIAIAGYCNGALIAYEAARRLADRNVPVDALILIDPTSFTVIAPALRRLVDRLDAIARRVSGRDGVATRLLGATLDDWHRLRELARAPWAER
ncbi:MAG: AMP-binding protein, partial [Alphaproteobacteria bacterium]|nr:AMP-binding protein [Alphaproteobacteria bacterium]